MCDLLPCSKYKAPHMRFAGTVMTIFFEYAKFKSAIGYKAFQIHV